ncbi:hypothetical protein OIU79_008938 [Salix purpurea]|uniref:Glycosyltransferase family 92 protein n=1 Tax=Salix purpurea TaxID=77065 RepID=A0A9Q0TJN5_SALPP|nr:hypothetical protein OIU79_008938 [Salix purpurea]
MVLSSESLTLMAQLLIISLPWVLTEADATLSQSLALLQNLSMFTRNPLTNVSGSPNRPSASNSTFSSVSYKMLPDWGYGHVYTVVVVNCTFSEAVNSENSGGKLFLEASTSGRCSKPKYDYLYCGSSLYGGLSPQRVREWIAYHVRLFGKRSHFVIHDAGGVHEEVLEVLKPWMELGYVTLQDIKEQERFDGYYHNQFMVNTIKSVLDSLSDYTQFTIEQMPMNNKLCLSADYGRYYRKWGFEKLVYKDVKKGIRRDRKYAIQPRNVFATGVHMSQNVAGKTTHKTEGKIRYFHYHGTIAQRREPCRNLVNVTEINFENNPYALDTTMRDLAWSVKKFEHNMIGPRLKNTRQ